MRKSRVRISLWVISVYSNLPLLHFFFDQFSFFFFFGFVGFDCLSISVKQRESLLPHSVNLNIWLPVLSGRIHSSLVCSGRPSFALSFSSLVPSAGDLQVENLPRPCCLRFIYNDCLLRPAETARRIGGFISPRPKFIPAQIRRQLSHATLPRAIE